MNFPDLAFYLFATVAALSALAVISVRNTVHAALCLVLCFFNAACLWILLQAEFLGLVLVLVYVGAVMVLFLFVVMMLDLNAEKLREGFARYLPVGATMALAMAVEMLVLLRAHGPAQAVIPVADPAAKAGTNNTAWLSQALFSQYTLPFEVAALILTVAVVAAILLTLRRRSGVRSQDPAQQVRVRAADRVRLVKMAAEQPAVDKPAIEEIAR
ncbi:MAG: NADH-quinone oxidoreductase subunit J [Proteobacteria bacterium]|nr:NADH-quinone oxidoreductase subunit J [Pseudomonadota bacterium]